MTQRRAMAELICKYQKERYGYEPDINEIIKYSMDKLVSFYWDALAFYNHNGTWFFSLDEIKQPVHNRHYFIRGETGVKQYHYWHDEFIFVGNLQEEIYKE
jgi:hypothetical protein